jgi:Arc/MetJ-type ribon-helix-helix transcriptional regulator
MSREVSLPDSLVENLQRRVQRSDFEDLDAYVQFVLEEVVTDHPELNEGAVDDTHDEAVREQLESLGYLDG